MRRWRYGTEIFSKLRKFFADFFQSLEKRAAWRSNPWKSRLRPSAYSHLKKRMKHLWVFRPLGLAGFTGVS